MSEKEMIEGILKVVAHHMRNMHKDVYIEKYGQIIKNGEFTDEAIVWAKDNFSKYNFSLPHELISD